MYQFIHIEIYAESVSKKSIERRSKINKNGEKNTGKRSLVNVNQVLAEAMRETNSCRHILHPEPPIHVFGMDLNMLEQEAITSKVGNSDKVNRKLRSDTPILLAGVASYPIDEYNSNRENFNSWLADNIVWLQKEYGNNLKNVTLHLDETHPHIHFYVISPTGRVKDLHPGYLADSSCNPDDTNGKKLSYMGAMRYFQDKYYEEVSFKHGMLRDGPRRHRKTRATYNAEKNNAKLLGIRTKELEFIEQAALDNALIERNSMLQAAHIEIEEKKAVALREIQHKREELIHQYRNKFGINTKLADTEAQLKIRDSELKIAREELEYFVSENERLMRKAKTERISP